jgi:CheY-like chemotaxis protein
MRSSKPILLVEDDDVDAMTTERALNELKVTNKLVRKTNGEDALDYLKDAKSLKPCIILLDLNMPRMNGLEFSKIVKADDVLKGIPVIVLTTSEANENIVESFGSSVAGYIVKPVHYKQYVEAMKTLDMYWELSRLPDDEQQISSIAKNGQVK